MRSTRRSSSSIFALAIALMAGGAADARAQGFVSPFIGYDYGGDSGCPTLTNCQDKKLNAGLALGVMGRALGFEEELGYARDFFGQSPGFDSSVITLMSNLVIAPKMGPVRPYVLGGVGLVRTHVSLTTPNLLTVNNNSAGWNLGWGMMGFFGSRVGVRGEIRHIHVFRDLNLFGFTLGDGKFDFGRASVGLVVMF
jgi:hypothetical protein